MSQLNERSVTNKSQSMEIETVGSLPVSLFRRIKSRAAPAGDVRVPKASKWLMIRGYESFAGGRRSTHRAIRCEGVAQQSYAVDLAATGEDALYQAEINSYDLFILDVMIPGIDGFSVCRKLRQSGIRDQRSLSTT